MIDIYLTEGEKIRAEMLYLLTVKIPEDDRVYSDFKEYTGYYKCYEDKNGKKHWDVNLSYLDTERYKLQQEAPHYINIKNNYDDLKRHIKLFSYTELRDKYVKERNELEEKYKEEIKKKQEFYEEFKKEQGENYLKLNDLTNAMRAIDDYHHHTRNLLEHKTLFINSKFFNDYKL